jgi:hypothetical protein
VSNARYLWDTLVPVSAYAQGVVATNITAAVNNCSTIIFFVFYTRFLFFSRN